MSEIIKSSDSDNLPLMLKITDKKFFCEILADVIAQAHLTNSDEKLRNRWIKAIAKAAAVILEGDTTFLHFDPQSKILYYWSPESNEIYQTGETCECSAYNQPKPQPCYHRAMSCLIKNYYEFQRKTCGELVQIDFADAVFIDAELSARKKVELLNKCILEGRSELTPRIEALKKFTSA
jgi:hypothetical protein